MKCITEVHLHQLWRYLLTQNYSHEWFSSLYISLQLTNPFLQRCLPKSDQKIGITGCLTAGPSTERQKERRETYLEIADFFSSFIFFCGSKFT